MCAEKLDRLIMTGYSAETVQSRFVIPRITAEKLGATVIQKPYALEELGRLVRETLDKNSQKGFSLKVATASEQGHLPANEEVIKFYD